MICEHTDPECHAHIGTPTCNAQATITLYRRDRYDVTGADFCTDCAAEALDSGEWQTRQNKKEGKHESV